MTNTWQYYLKDISKQTQRDLLLIIIIDMSHASIGIYVFHIYFYNRLLMCVMVTNSTPLWFLYLHGSMECIIEK
jgi:hypothetical protein